MSKLAPALILAALISLPATGATAMTWGKITVVSDNIIGGDFDLEIRETVQGMALKRTRYRVSSYRRNPEEMQIDWADGRTCPGIAISTAKLPALALPVFRAPKPLHLPARVSHPKIYTIEGPASWGGIEHPMRLSGEWPGPLPTWVDDLMGSVSECWGPSRPDNVYEHATSTP